MHIIFSHGQESGPWGGKINHLAAIASTLGCTFASLNYREKSELAQRVKLLTDYLASDHCPAKSQVILVGSSMGALVSIAATHYYPVAGLFLLAPAFGLFDDWPSGMQAKAVNSELVHGWHDELIPPQTVFDWALKHQCTLHMVDDGHRLLLTLPVIGQWFREFIITVGRAHNHDN